MPSSLNGATVKGNAYVFTNPGTGIKSVGFWLDDPTHTGRGHAQRDDRAL